MGRRKWVAAGGLAVFLGRLGLIPFLGVQFFGQEDTGQFALSLETPPGTSLAETDFVVQYVEGLLLQQPEVDSVFSSVGGGGQMGAENPEQAEMLVTLKEQGATVLFTDRMRELLADIPGLAFSNQSVGGDGSSASLVARQVLLSVQGGASIDELEAVSRDLVDRMRDIPGAADVDRSYKLGKPELQISVDRAKAADLDVNAAAAAITVRTLVNGSTASTLREGDRETDILVQLRAADRSRPEDMLTLTVPSSRGVQVPLSTFMSLRTVLGPTQIDRVDRQPRVLVGANVVDRSESEVTSAAQQILGDMDIPPGVTVTFAGSSEQSDESFQALLTALFLSVVFVYMVLASQFGSFIHPFTIMLSLPLALGGALMALLLAGKPLDVMGMIGIIMLMGLVTKNAILLMDFILRARRAGVPRTEAILQAGPIRLRPILMTTMAMIAGMLPVALGVLGAGSAWRAPMAIAVIGGLITSTALTLVVMPVVYTLLDDAQNFFSRRGRTTQEAELVAALAGDSTETGH